MCGISGVISLSQKLLTKSLEIDSLEKLISNMLDKASYRGPDDRGVIVHENNVALGHSRLSIIDLSSHSVQPMEFNEFVITFNGEIYNYLELKEELTSFGYTFATDSDTEVLLKAFDRWGSECLEHLNGMFSFAIYNKKDKTIFLARDRLGEKPLYYYYNDDFFIFASEIKQILALELLKAKANDKAIIEYLTMQYTLSEHTLFDGIYRVLPGESIFIKSGIMHKNIYWDLDEIKLDKSKTKACFQNDIEALMKESVRLRMRSDVPLGCYLSGGLDSSIISALASKSNREKLRTFTFSSASNKDESKVAAKSAVFFDAENTVGTLPENNFFELWKKMTYVLDEPVVGYSLIPQYLMSEQVKKHSTVVLGGQGGDELFFGYGWHTTLTLLTLNPLLSPIRYLKLLKNHFNSFNPKVIYRQLRALISVSGTTLFEKYFSLWRSNSCFNFLNNDAKNTGRSSFLQVTNNISSDNNYEVLRKFEIKYWLQSLLQVEDRCSMFASIESRVPILDHNLVELALSIPAEYCIDGGYNKKIFKDSFSEELPDWIKNAKNKSGYEVPIADWLALPEVKCFLDSCLLGKRKKFLSRFLQEDFNFDKLSARQVWMIGSLVIWAESNNVI